MGAHVFVQMCVKGIRGITLDEACAIKGLRGEPARLRSLEYGPSSEPAVGKPARRPGGNLSRGQASLEVVPRHGDTLLACGASWR